MNRGDRRENIFVDGWGSAGLLNTLARRAKKLFETNLESRCVAEEQEADWKPLRRGWRLGGEECRYEMCERMAGEFAEHHAGVVKRESTEAIGERPGTPLPGAEFSRPSTAPKDRSSQTQDRGAPA
jgi:hypothetical protein